MFDHLTVPIDKIPNEVMEELHCEFHKVDFTNYGTPTRGTQSKRFGHCSFEPLTGMERVADPFSFDDMWADHTTHCYKTKYMARGYFKDKVADIRAIFEVRGVEPLE